MKTQYLPEVTNDYTFVFLPDLFWSLVLPSVVILSLIILIAVVIRMVQKRKKQK